VLKPPNKSGEMRPITRSSSIAIRAERPAFIASSHDEIRKTPLFYTIPAIIAVPIEVEPIGQG
jgi:hypothetical protein